MTLAIFVVEIVCAEFNWPESAVVVGLCPLPSVCRRRRRECLVMHSVAASNGGVLASDAILVFCRVKLNLSKGCLLHPSCALR